MPKIKANGIDLYYEIHGQGEPLVLIMGLRRNAEGGYIAQELAINYPEMVQGLILGCTGSGGRGAVLMTPERLEKFIANKGLSPEEILRKDMDIYFSEGFIRENPEKIEEFVEISRRYYQPSGSFLRQFAACQKHDTFERLQRITQPCLIMTGDDDPLVPPGNSRILKEMIPQSRLEFFSAGRHCFFMEFAPLFNRQVIDFLDTEIDNFPASCYTLPISHPF